jgi:hypothetical protein
MSAYHIATYPSTSSCHTATLSSIQCNVIISTIHSACHINVHIVSHQQLYSPRQYPYSPRQHPYSPHQHPYSSTCHILVIPHVIPVHPFSCLTKTSERHNFCIRPLFDPI